MTRPETSLRNLIDEQFGPYKVIRRLGIGGMAETFEAIRSGPSGFEQRVCLKLVLPFFQQDAGFIELFHREAKLAAKLRHSNIVGVIDFGEVGGKSYMALELVDGCDLRMLLDAQDPGRLSAEHVALIGLDLAAALEHAHNPDERDTGSESGRRAQGIVHRDLSPSNVLISRRGEIMLTDFGVAKAITGTARKQSSIKGKIPYMSPEQLKGEVVDGRADLFALGAVLFEALSGQRPYEGTNDPATILLTLTGEHPSLQTLAPSAPPKLVEVIEKLVIPDVEQRPQTAAELTELLDELTPSHRTRRELGELVAKLPRAIEPLAPTESSAVGRNNKGVPVPTAPNEETGVGRRKRLAADSVAEPSAPPAKKPKWRGLAIVAVLALVVGSAAGAAILWPTSEDRDFEAASPTPPEEATVEKADPQPEAAPPPKPTELAQPEPTKPQRKAPPVAPTPARLTVIAIPWGSVWIDGKPEGSSPVKNKSMKPGRYEISTGQGSPSQKQTVRLRAGQRKTVKFDLTE